MAKSDEFEMTIRIWTDNRGNATADLEPKIGGEATGQKEPTFEHKALSEVFSHMAAFFGSMVDAERQIENLLKRSENAN